MKLSARIFGLGILFLLLLANEAYTQAYPITNQYLLNPYVYNPAFAGASGYTEVFASYRTQWASIEGAPETALFTISHPTASRLSIGGIFRSDERGLLRTNSVQGTIVTSVPIWAGHSLSAGISAGATHTTLETSSLSSDIYASDPMLSETPFGNMDLDVSVGIRYGVGGFQLGLAIPRVVSPVYLVSASYRIDTKSAISIEPNVLFRTTEGLPSRTEAGLTVYLGDQFWLGGAYRQSYGGMAFAGVRALDRLTLSYSYEAATVLTGGMPNSTHELMVGIRIGQKKESLFPEADKPRREILIVQNPPDTEESDDPGAVELPADPPIIPSGELVDTPPAPVADTSATIAKELASRGVTEARVESVTPGMARDQGLETLEGGHYVMIGAYQFVANADRFVEETRSKGYPVDMFFNPSRNLYYVYSQRYDLGDISNAVQHFQDLLKTTEFEDAWIFTIEE